ncbi:hypothetical protein HDU92_005025, partial [Lobulomyces angularis]
MNENSIDSETIEEEELNQLANRRQSVKNVTRQVEEERKRQIELNLYTDAQVELLRKVNQKEANNLVEEERQRRLEDLRKTVRIAELERIKSKKT